LAEHRGRHVGVVHGGRLVAKDRLEEGSRLRDRHRREIHSIGAVADRVDARHRGSRIAVDANRAFFVELDAALLEADAARVRHAADRGQHRVDVEAIAVAERRAKPSAGALDRLDRRPETEVDRALLHLGGEPRAEVVVEAAEKKGVSVNERHLGAEPV
jgi:hypothetical protein